MRYAWHITNELHLHALVSIIGSSVGITAIWENGLVVGQPLPSPTIATSITTQSTSSGALVTFEHSSGMFMASIGQGWPRNTALRAWSPILTGHYSSNGKFFGSVTISQNVQKPNNGICTQSRLSRVPAFSEYSLKLVVSEWNQYMLHIDSVVKFLHIYWEIVPIINSVMFFIYIYCTAILHICFVQFCTIFAARM